MAFRLFLGNVSVGEAQALTPSLYVNGNTFYALVATGLNTLEPEYFSKKPYVAIVLAA